MSDVPNSVLDLKADIQESRQITTEFNRKYYFHILNCIENTLNTTISKPDSYQIDENLLNRIKNNININKLFDKIESQPEIISNMYVSILEDNEYLKSNGQFFTPKQIADFMISIENINKGDKILEPSCGHGVFLDSIIEENQDVDLTAVDKDPLLIYSSKIRSEINEYSDKVDFRSTDYIKEFEQNTEYDLIIGNPPYNKFQNYDSEMNDIINVSSEYDIGKLANLYALFFLKSSSIIKDNGHIIFITPSEYLDTGYGSELKRLFKDNFSIKKFVKIDWDKESFDALTTVCITVLQKNQDTEDTNVRFCVSNSPDDLDLIINEDKDTTKIKQSNLSIDDKWTRYFKDIKNEQYLKKTVQLDEFVETKRGIATGYNDYFTFSKSELDKWDIEQKYLKPVLTKSNYAKNYVFNDRDFKHLCKKDKKSYLLYYQDGDVSDNLSSYIDYGKEIDANERYLTKNRDPWYTMEERDPPPILATVFSRDDMRFIYNSKNVLTLAAFHGLYPKQKDEKWIKSLLAYLNSDVALELAKTQHREYADGLSKFEPDDILDIPVLDFYSLSKNNINYLSDIFDRLDECRRQESKNEEIIRDELNEEIKRLFEQN